jgi:PST family polysaccharide transporter
MTERASGRSATLWVGVEKAAQQLFWLILFTIMAPILGPRPYGQFALVMVFIGFCEMILVDAAVEALVSLKSVSRAHLKTALLANTTAAAVVALLAWLAAAPIDALLDEPELDPVFRALALLPVLSALTAGPIGLLRCALAFRPLALRSIVGLGTGGAVGVAVALRGGGVWALVAQALVQRAVELVVLWLAQPDAIAFGWSTACWDELKRFARSVMVGRAMYWASGQVPRLIIGATLGPVPLGLFSLAGRAAEALLQIAVIPRSLVARIELMDDRGHGVRFEARIRAMARGAALIAFPTAIGAAAVTPELFQLWLDARWQDGVVPTQLMLLGAVPMLGHYFCTAGLMAAGRPDLEARLSVWQSVSNALVTLLAAPFGLSATVAAMLARQCALLPLALARIAGAAGIRAARLVEGTLPILGAAAVMGLATYASGRLVALPGPAAVRLALLVLEGVALYVVALLVVDPALVRLLVRGTAARAPDRS